MTTIISTIKAPEDISVNINFTQKNLLNFITYVKKEYLRCLKRCEKTIEIKIVYKV